MAVTKPAAPERISLSERLRIEKPSYFYNIGTDLIDAYNFGLLGEFGFNDKGEILISGSDETIGKFVGEINTVLRETDYVVPNIPVPYDYGIKIGGLIRLVINSDLKDLPYYAPEAYSERLISEEIIDSIEQRQSEYTQMQFLLSGWLISKMKDNSDPGGQRQAAELVLKIFSPLMRIYQLPEVTSEMEDLAFEIRYPELYQQTLEIWNGFYGKRYSQSEVRSMEKQLKDGFSQANKEMLRKLSVKRNKNKIKLTANGYDIDSEEEQAPPYIFLRQKSLLSFFRKSIGRMKANDFVYRGIEDRDTLIKFISDGLGMTVVSEHKGIRHIAPYCFKQLDDNNPLLRSHERNENDAYKKGYLKYFINGFNFYGIDLRKFEIIGLSFMRWLIMQRNHEEYKSHNEERVVEAQLEEDLNGRLFATANREMYDEKGRRKSDIEKRIRGVEIISTFALMGLYAQTDIMPDQDIPEIFQSDVRAIVRAEMKKDIRTRYVQEIRAIGTYRGEIVDLVNYLYAIQTEVGWAHRYFPGMERLTRQRS